jgi:exodeoxyribonuclease VII small subunit
MAKGRGEAERVRVEDVMEGRVEPEQLARLKFEEALELLEGVVEAVESGSLPLDQAMSAYERGTQLVQHLRSLLAGAEEKLRVL